MGSAQVILFLGLCLSCSGFNVDTQLPVIKQAGVAGGMFGFSVTMHQQSEGEQRYLLLSGAPQDAAPPGVKANRTGALYACPITTLTSDCFRVSINQESQPGKNIIEDMWLGVTVESQGPDGRVLVCAHRYTAVQWSGSEDQRRMIGKCYVRGNDLEFNDADDWQTYHNELCNSNTDHERTGMCQLGISGGFTKNMLYFGAPGAYNWQGTDFILQRDNWDLKEVSYPSEKLLNIYMGYSVQLGKGVLLQNDVTIVSGAPRWNHKGAVYLMEVVADSMKLKQVLSGEQVGSYFGNVVALADFNNDGWQEIAVGAPFYFNRKEELGGAVYIYTNEVGSFTDKPSVVLYGPTASGFGFALANIGDINQDGFTDLVVGAPFEDMGKVYIYHSKSSGLQSKPSQIIDGSQIGFSTFGYSLGGGLDIDQNSYPDLLVGSLADRIALLRSRPVINISKEFAVTPTIVDPSKCSSTSCMDVRLCFSYMLSTGNANYKNNITLQYTVDADFDRRPSRVRFLGAPSGVYKGYFSMPETKCQNHQLFLLDNIRDKLRPIHISLKYSVLEQAEKGENILVSLDNFPVLNQDQSQEQILEIHFQKECGTDNVCRSNLQMQYEYLWEDMEPLPSTNGTQILHYDSNVKYFLLRVTVTNAPSVVSAADDAHEAFLNITVPDELLYRRFTFQSGSCTFEGTILCELGNPFKRNQKAVIDITFEASGIALKTREVMIGLELSTLSKQTDLHKQYAELLVDYTLQTSLSVSPVNLQTYFSGQVIGESAMVTEDDVGSPVTFTFLVGLYGQPLNSLGSLILAVEWPYEVANGKWLLYPTEVLVNTGNVTRCQPPGNVIDPLNLTMSNRRRRREVGELADVQTLPAVKRERPNTSLKCGGGGANCVRFQCPLDDMKLSATVTVHGRVWNSTFLEDYRHIDRVWVEGSAELYLKTDIHSINMQSHHVTFSVSIDSELVELPPAELPLWVIIVSVGSGVLLLGIIILFLWKCGFFRRANIRAKYEVRGQKAEMKVQPSETERLTQEF
ncbi:integrin alpha-3 isoform X2 [Pseudophryne corroboree]|uniref:integrin alpha-3 isoform X2 n=1 Tax=Pseudophryne corroboree TaxID=495146 RepID=UPI003081C186